MIGTAASLGQHNGEAGNLQPLVITSKALAVQIGLAGRIERLTQKHRRRGCDLWLPEGNVCALRSVHRRHRLLLVAVLLYSVYSALIPMVMAQVPTGKAAEPKQPTLSVPTDLSPVPAEVSVHPVARDEQIRARLERVLLATGSFTNPGVRVEDGVVFLHGKVESAELKKWAGDLARNTQDVVAVANQMEVIEPPVWDFGPAWSGLLVLWRDFIRSLPTLGFGLFILALSAGAGMLGTWGARAFLLQRVTASLLRDVIACGAGVLIFLFGTYIVLRVCGLTQLALTVVGGTGLIGLAVGLAFKDITENFLASIVLSMQRPFETGDLLEVVGVTGYVQQLNVRSTILMTLDGNLVQIPNATIYKSNLRNFTTNSNRREDFVVGIGYGDSINDAQEIARKVLVDHPAVLNDPEPLVLADSLGQATINLRVYFWLNGREHSWLKVRSSVIRLVKLAFQEHGISMPDEAREVVFPEGVPVTILAGKPAEEPNVKPRKQLPADSPQGEPAAVSTKAEAGFSSEADVIEEQARQAQPLKHGENLLKAAPRGPVPEKGAKVKP
jgi:small-conductance mechanosensitive channel